MRTEQEIRAVIRFIMSRRTDTMRTPVEEEKEIKVLKLLLGER